MNEQEIQRAKATARGMFAAGHDDQGVRAFTGAHHLTVRAWRREWERQGRPVEAVPGMESGMESASAPAAERAPAPPMAIPAERPAAPQVIRVGAVVEGVVNGVTEYGVFVDLLDAGGGRVAKGLVHRSGFVGRGERFDWVVPSLHFRVGDAARVRVLDAHDPLRLALALAEPVSATGRLEPEAPRPAEASEQPDPPPLAECRVVSLHGRHRRKVVIFALSTALAAVLEADPLAAFEVQVDVTKLQQETQKGGTP